MLQFLNVKNCSIFFILIGKSSKKDAKKGEEKNKPAKAGAGKQKVV